MCVKCVYVCVVCVCVCVCACVCEEREREGLSIKKWNESIIKNLAANNVTTEKQYSKYVVVGILCFTLIFFGYSKMRPNLTSLNV